MAKEELTKTITLELSDEALAALDRYIQKADPTMSRSEGLRKFIMERVLDDD